MTGPPSRELSYDVVVPTVGRPSLSRLLESLDSNVGPAPHRVVLVDDRPGENQPLDLSPAPGITNLLRVVRSGGKGPAAARNIGWRLCSSEWVVFLDDDVVAGPSWREDLVGDLTGCGSEVVGVQGMLEVPLPQHRRPTDWERNVAGLARARWATADIAYRRWALELVDGFDDRFPRAYREDADLALRLEDAGLTLRQGARASLHPPGPNRFARSLSRQAGNQDDPLMFLIHGARWRDRAGVPGGRRPIHLLTVVVAGIAIQAMLKGRRRPWAEIIWLAATVQYAWSRLRGGPMRWREALDMAATSALIPPLAAAHWAYGWVRGLFKLRRDRRVTTPDDAIPAPIEAVLFDRDGTLVYDVPYNGDPEKVQPVPDAPKTVSRLRAHGLRTGVISNQSGVGRGAIDLDAVNRVNERIDELLGPFDTWQICPHTPEARCGCRKPAPGMVLKAAADMGVAPGRCVVIGDIGSDVEAARAAGAGHILIPTWHTRPSEISDAGNIAADLNAAYAKLVPFLGVSA